MAFETASVAVQTLVNFLPTPIIPPVLSWQGTARRRWSENSAAILSGTMTRTANGSSRPSLSCRNDGASPLLSPLPGRARHDNDAQGFQATFLRRDHSGIAGRFGI